MFGDSELWRYAHLFFRWAASLRPVCLSTRSVTAPCKRRAPVDLEAEVACIAGVVAPTAQRRHLAIHPPLTRDSILCEAMVAEPSGPQAAVDTWAEECGLIAKAKHLEFVALVVHGRRSVCIIANVALVLHHGELLTGLEAN